MARHVAPLLSRWSSQVFAVELNGAPFYFALEELRRREAPRLFAQLRERARCYSLLVCGAGRVQAARLHAELEGRLSRELPPGCNVSPMSSFLPNVRGSLIKGYFLEDTSGSPSCTERLLSGLAQRDPVLVCSYTRGERGQVWTQRVWSGEEEGAQGGRMEFCVVPSEAPGSHPSTLNMINSDVFRSYEEAYGVLTQCGDIIPEAASVLELLGGRAQARNKPDFPVIVIEGLDATGKTTLTESLKDALGAALLRSPPQCMSPWRARFDQEPPLIRRAFYALGNYITAEQICQEATKTPVIVDRFWHSTAAYAIATAVSGPVCNLPEEGSEVYRWPGDLLQPSLVVVLSLDPEERARRLRSRGQGKTNEEQQLDHNQLFRLRVEEAYRRITGPACIVVDASPPADQVLQQVLLLIRGKCHL